MTDGAVGVLIAIAALLGPALVATGIFIGNARASSSLAHVRLDKLEASLVAELRLLRAELRDVVKEAWRLCPLANETHTRKLDGTEGP